ncbi:MAG: MFS transporter [Chloroflexi bacterium]|nr:MFS transporter [Chloroflexota bacterium]
MSRFLAAMSVAVSATASALENPSTRRVQAASLLGFVVDSALLVLLAVTVFAVAGAVGVAAIGVARVASSSVFGVLAAAPLARWRADRVLVALGIARGLAATVATAAILFRSDPSWLFLVAAVMGASAAIQRPAQSTLLPALARTPEELVTANVASSTAEAVGSFAGPLMAAFFIATGAPAAAGLTLVVTQIVGVIALSDIHFEDQHDARGPTPNASGGGLALGTGIAAIRERPAIAIVIAGFGLQTLVRGLLATLAVVLSVQLIELGEAGVGLLGAAMGVGGVLGIVVGLALRRSSPNAFVVALAGWGLPIAFIGVLPLPVVAILAFALTGLSNALLDIVGFTLLQRGCRNEDRGAVFAIFEGATAVSAAIGYILAPAFVAVFGIRSALVATGAILPVAAVIIWVLLRRESPVEAVPWTMVERLRDVPAFRVLPLTGIERLVSGAVPVAFSAGAVIMEKGAAGDTFLVIEVGEVIVSDEGRVLGALGPGAGIGEIALIRGVPRTATVTALTDVTALSFDAAAVLAAVSGPAATSAASRVMDERLARSAAD